jgi:hypothetical protein
LDESESNDEEEEEEEEEGFGSDDDDNTWKVRKAAVRVVSAVIVARPEMIEMLLRTCTPELVGRFREREENVRLDVLACFTTLLQASMSSVANRSTKRKTSIPTIVHTPIADPGSSALAPGKILYFRNCRK